MARETDAILQGILYQQSKIKKDGGSIEDCLKVVKSMCTKENLDAVKALLAEDEL